LTDLRYKSDSDAEEIREEGDCHILNAQNALVSSYLLGRNMFIGYNFVRMFGESTLLIMVDTSMYDADAPDYLPCYGNMFPERPYDLQSVREYQLSEILRECRAIQDIIKTVVICGHHPITGIKAKAGKLKTIAASGPFVQFLFEIKRVFQPNTKYIYLCADLHCYQQGTVMLYQGEIEMRIDQYIVGTGGAGLDTVSIQRNYPTQESTIPNSPYSVEYTLIPPSTYKDALTNSVNHGYLKCVEKADGGLSIDFVSTFKTTGGRTRRKKRRTRKN